MPDQVDSDAYRIAWLNRRLYRAMGYQADGYLEGLGISTADRVVLEFIDPDKKLSVSEIARRYRVSRQHVRFTVNSLIDRGLASAVDKLFRTYRMATADGRAKHSKS